MQSGTSEQLPAPPDDLLSGASLFLDFDGTLVEIADRPDAVRVDARLHELIATLVSVLDGRVALISGRPASEVRGFLGGGAMPGFAIAGSHGMEFLWADGRRTAAERPASLAEVHAEMTALAAENPGVMVEDKPLGAALHFRQAPEAESACRALATKLAEVHGLKLQPGKMLFEVRTSGGDKGRAIATFMEQAKFAGTRPVFLGDDTTDEPGFEAAETLGGAGVLVGPPRDTSASYRLGGVSATLDWLAAATEALA
ncbi:trehalose-phosphatase [Stakelama tenebrarum]|uniref:trehalose-phosphatase n=1 Tax=Stakelama tenebrarum TaxID=2711215 RepID=UPI001D17F7A1|nr:trehalose-phosphatase [Sphingosinithalassobacter tenebrarum]